MPYKDPQSPAAIASRMRTEHNWRNRHPEAYKRLTKNANLRKKFGITIEDYERMHKTQNGLCAICQKPEKYASKNPQSSGQILSLAVDHDHSSLQVRALLCMDCNKGLGCFGEEILRLQAAIDYLRKHSRDN